MPDEIQSTPSDSGGLRDAAFPPPFPQYFVFVVLPDGSLAINAHDRVNGDQSTPEPYTGCVFGMRLLKQEALEVLTRLMTGVVNGDQFAISVQASPFSAFIKTGLSPETESDEPAA